MRVELHSKLIETVAYEEEQRLLRVYLTNGQLREYRGVPQAVVDGLIKARSAGHYFMENIRGHFPQVE